MPYENRSRRIGIRVALRKPTATLMTLEKRTLKTLKTHKSFSQCLQRLPLLRLQRRR
jgi:hypothetical protein